MLNLLPKDEKYFERFTELAVRIQEAAKIVARFFEGEAPVGGLCVNSGTWRLLEHRCTGHSLGLRELKGKGMQELFQIDSVRD
jgi:hypothetical protein